MWTAVLIWLKKLAWPIAALLGLLAILLSRKGGNKGEAEKAREALEQALLREIDERRKRGEVIADVELERKRAGSRADRLAGAMLRARARLRDDPKSD